MSDDTRLVPSPTERALAAIDSETTKNRKHLEGVESRVEATADNLANLAGTSVKQAEKIRRLTDRLDDLCGRAERDRKPQGVPGDIRWARVLGAMFVFFVFWSVLLGVPAVIFWALFT